MVRFQQDCTDVGSAGGEGGKNVQLVDCFNLIKHTYHSEVFYSVCYVLKSRFGLII